MPIIKQEEWDCTVTNHRYRHINKGEKMFEKIAVKIIRKLISLLLPEYHLHKDPKRKGKEITE